MIYSSIEEVFKDFNYLVKECSIEQLASNRPDISVIEKYLSQLQSFDDMFVLKFFQSLIKDFGLKVSNWKNEVIVHKLPALVLIPEVGIRVCVEKNDEGLKLKGKDGVVEYFQELPQNSFVLEFGAKKEIEKKYTATQMFKDIALKQKKYIIYAAVASLSINIFALVSSIYSMQVYDRVIPTAGISTLVSLSIGAFIAILLEMVLKIARSSILEKANKNMDMEYSHKIFNQFLKVRCDNLPKSIGMLSGQLQSYASVRAFISSMSIFIFIDLPFALFFLSIIILIGGIELGGVVLVFLLLSVISGMMYKNKIDVLTKTSTMSSYKKLGLLVETVENAESIKSSYNGWKIQNRWNKLTNDSIEDDLEIKHFTDISSYITAFIQQISYVLLVATGAYIVSSSDKLTMGSIIAVSILSSRVFSPFASIPSLFISWGRTKMSLDDLNKVFGLQVDNNGKKGLHPTITNADLVCQDIGFAYSQDSAVLKTTFLKIHQGEKVGILGMIGSGKSTLLKILAGLYKVQQGIVTLNGVDIQQISREKVAHNIGYLPQNVKLLSGTLRDNLTLGMLGVSDEKIIEMAKQSGLIQLINSLPKGLDTPIPDGSESVSSGQRQLIGLTRIMILDPKIWLLDEPTANIDEGTERLILKYFDENLKDKTLIIISHKQSSFSIVDRLIVMNQNSVILDGNKDEVISKVRGVA